MFKKRLNMHALYLYCSQTPLISFMPFLLSGRVFTSYVRWCHYTIESMSIWLNTYDPGPCDMVVVCLSRSMMLYSPIDCIAYILVWVEIRNLDFSILLWSSFYSHYFLCDNMCLEYNWIRWCILNILSLA